MLARLIDQTYDILDKWEFFYGQRAGRDRWARKPADIQEQDLADFNRDIGVISTTIEALAEGRRWIPVTESLPRFTPNKWRNVLVTLEDASGKGFVTTARYNEKRNRWYGFNDWRFGDFKVLAWMPKPEAYKPPKEG